MTIDGKQKDLGVSDPKDEAAAAAAYRRLLAAMQASIPPTGPATTVKESLTVRGAVAAFISDAKARELSAGTVAGYRHYLDHFSKQFGELTITDVRPEMVEAWARKPSWSQSTRHNALTAVAMMLKYSGHPIRLRIPPKQSAGAKSVIPPDVYTRILNATSGDFRQLVRFMWAVGCRPAEAAELTVDMVDLQSCTIRKDKHKTMRYTGKARIIYLTGDGLAVVCEQLVKYAAGGPIFRGIRGKPWKKKTWVARFKTLSKKVGWKLTAKFFRHTYCTNALQNGVPEAHVAALVGHETTRMLSQHYSHLGTQARTLLDAAAKVRPA